MILKQLILLDHLLSSQSNITGNTGLMEDTIIGTFTSNKEFLLEATANSTILTRSTPLPQLTLRVSAELSSGSGTNSLI